MQRSEENYSARFEESQNAVDSEPWRRRTGNENGLLLLELKDTLDARRRERKGEPV